MRSSLDFSYMALAVEEASLYIGATNPNPPVGACLVKDNIILAVGAHKHSGTEHAEIAALRLAYEKYGKKKVEGATLYVTLEPCNHFGKTPPCTRALLEARLARVVYACKDPNTQVTSVSGAEYLRSQGLEVHEGVGRASSLGLELLRPFTKWVTQKLPWVVHKIAYRIQDSQFTMLPERGEKTFTSIESLQLAHLERRKSDAILTGMNTVLLDRPLFNVRHVSDHPQKKRILAVLSQKNRVLPEDWVLRQKELGFEILQFEDIKTALKTLAEKNVLQVLVEAGPGLSKLIEEQKLWDERFVFIGSPQGKDLNFRELCLPE